MPDMRSLLKALGISEDVMSSPIMRMAKRPQSVPRRPLPSMGSNVQRALNSGDRMQDISASQRQLRGFAEDYDFDAMVSEGLDKSISQGMAQYARNVANDMSPPDRAEIIRAIRRAILRSGGSAIGIGGLGWLGHKAFTSGTASEPEIGHELVPAEMLPDPYESDPWE